MAEMELVLEEVEEAGSMVVIIQARLEVEEAMLRLVRRGDIIGPVVDTREQEGVCMGMSTWSPLWGVQEVEEGAVLTGFTILE